MADCIKCGSYTKFEKGHCYKCFMSIKYSKNNINIKEHLPSEGEEFIREFFKSQNIKFVPEQEIVGLKNDDALIRKADFYLPKYSLYLEFLGQWNVEEERPRYIAKMETYSLNNIPCVFLYPENLGIIEHVFDKRIQKILTAHKMEKQLFKYRFLKLLKGECERFLYLLLAIVGLCLIDYKKEPETNINYVLGYMVFIGYQIVRFVAAYYKVFKLNNYPLAKL